MLLDGGEGNDLDDESCLTQLSLFDNSVGKAIVNSQARIKTMRYGPVQRSVAYCVQEGSRIHRGQRPTAGPRYMREQEEVTGRG
jgi:hypothetical protein